MTVALRSAVTGKCESSSFVILFQDRLGYSKPLVIPYETEDFFPIFVKKKSCWNFDRGCIDLADYVE